MLGPGSVEVMGIEMKDKARFENAQSGIEGASQQGDDSQRSGFRFGFEFAEFHQRLNFVGALC